MAVNTVVRPDLPDLVIHNLFRCLPTKAAVRVSFLSKKWEGVLAWAPILDFDEGGNQYGGDNNLEQHKKFVDNILKKYLELCDREKHKQMLLDKFRLHMTSYSYRDAIVVNNLLNVSFKRSVKEVDISLRVSNLEFHPDLLKSYYCLSKTTFLNAKCVTNMTLEYVRIKNIYGNSVHEPTSTPLLPSLKAMTLKTVHIDGDALFDLIGHCPSVEYLSLISCFFAHSKICISSSTLKLLESKNCQAYLLHVRQAFNLESVAIFSSRKFLLDKVVLEKCCNFRYMNICACHMRNFYLDDCREVKGTIWAPNLEIVSIEAYLNSKFSLEASRLRTTRIILLDTCDSELSTTSNEPWKHFHKLKDFLAEFGTSKVMDLFVRDFKVVMFPKSFQNMFPSPILPKLVNLFFAAQIHPTEGKEWKELTQCFRWMSPSAKSIYPLKNKAELLKF